MVTAGFKLRYYIVFVSRNSSINCATYERFSFDSNIMAKYSGIQ